MKASCRWSGAAAIIPTKTVSAGSARAGACRAANALSVMRRDWPISTIRAVCSRCWKSMKMMRNRYCSRANRFGSAKSPDGHYVIASLDGSIALRFAPLVVAEDGSDEDSTLFPPVVVEDANGNHQRFVYHAGRSAAIRHRRQRLGVLAELRQCGGRAISLRRQQRVDQTGVC